MPSLSSLLLLLSAASAAPADAPVEDLYGRVARAESLRVILGGADRRPLAWAPEIDGALSDDPWRAGAITLLENEVAGEAMGLEAAALRPVAVVRGWTRVSVGDGRTQGLLGDAEPGLVSPRLGASLSLSSSWFEAHGQVQARVDVLGASPEYVTFAVPEAWAGLRHGPLRAGFGLERRFFGPARHGALILGDDAAPFPAGSVAAEGELWRLGLLRADVGAGWLQRPRGDLNKPGLLWMDLRWAPLPWVELGATRASLFAGEGRPWPSVGQLILPTDPHIEGDPDREAPDQDEMAALDGRLTVPLGRWLPVVDYLELYTQYGGDDMIMRSLGPLPRPSLAGIANLFGAELALGPLALNVEYARLMDDRFRWYTGHRIYHEGFYQSGRPMGHVNGGDAQTWWGRASYLPGPWGAELWTEQVWRVGVVELVEDSLFTLQTDERRQRYGARGWWFAAEGWRLGAGYELERLTGEDFIPGADDTRHRAWVELSSAPFVFGGQGAGGQGAGGQGGW